MLVPLHDKCFARTICPDGNRFAGEAPKAISLRVSVSFLITGDRFFSTVVFPFRNGERLFLRNAFRDPQ